MKKALILALLILSALPALPAERIKVGPYAGYFRPGDRLFREVYGDGYLIYGGRFGVRIIQGISYALHEERKLDRQTGVMVNANLESYKISGAREVPKIEVHFVEEYLGRSSTDAGGIGEPATVPTAAALANAFHNATGVRMRQLPMTPARVLQALGRTGGAR